MSLFMRLERNTENETFVFKTNEKQKILRMIIDNELASKTRVKNLCKKVL